MLMQLHCMQMLEVANKVEVDVRKNVTRHLSLPRIFTTNEEINGDMKVINNVETGHVKLMSNVETLDEVAEDKDTINCKYAYF